MKKIALALLTLVALSSCTKKYCGQIERKITAYDNGKQVYYFEISLYEVDAQVLEAVSFEDYMVYDRNDNYCFSTSKRKFY